MSFQLPQSEDVVTRSLLQRNARSHPTEVCVSFENGNSWTYREALSSAAGAAQTLAASGVRQGDCVAVFLPNGEDFLRALWGTAFLGATVVPVNLAYRGSMLRHLFELAEPRVVIVGNDLEERVAELDSDAVVLRPSDLALTGEPPALERPIELWDSVALNLTSGTTGPSKLAALSYYHMYLGGSHVVEGYDCGPDDVYQIDLPLFHVAMLYQLGPCLATRTRLAIRSRPNLSRYWEVLRETGATVVMLLSTMVPYLISQAPRPIEREHRVRLMPAYPLPSNVEAFKRRFGVAELHAAYGSTEAPGPVIRHADDKLVSNYCGRVRPGYEVRIVDEHDIELPHGEVGECVMRGEQPWMLTAEYVGTPDATAAAWRNGWFHSGDAMRRDEEGRFFFVDRLKEAIRRRGENVSTFEVEAEVSAYPGIEEVACVPYRDEGAVDDEVKVWLVLEEGTDISFDELLEFCAGRMPHFMVPRYFEVTDHFPKTPSERVKKHELRDRGNSKRTWDREQHGYGVTRSGLVLGRRCRDG